jgi:hypothetical protein
MIPSKNLSLSKDCVAGPAEHLGYRMVGVHVRVKDRLQHTLEVLFSLVRGQFLPKSLHN